MTMSIIKDLLREMERQYVIMASGIDEIKETLKRIEHPMIVVENQKVEKHKETHDEMLDRMAKVREARNAGNNSNS